MKSWMHRCNVPWPTRQLLLLSHSRKEAQKSVTTWQCIGRATCAKLRRRRAHFCVNASNMCIGRDRCRGFIRHISTFERTVHVFSLRRDRWALRFARTFSSCYHTFTKTHKGRRRARETPCLKGEKGAERCGIDASICASRTPAAPCSPHLRRPFKKGPAERNHAKPVGVLGR